MDKKGIPHEIFKIIDQIQFSSGHYNILSPQSMQNVLSIEVPASI